jgi:2-iminobutanoate/2-iminopropanoate deaminase
MKKIISIAGAPAPIGPYSQAILKNDTLYASGQIAIDPVTGELVMDTLTEETTQVMKNIEALLTAAQMEFGDIVKCSIY